MIGIHQGIEYLFKLKTVLVKRCGIHGITCGRISGIQPMQRLSVRLSIIIELQSCNPLDPATLSGEVMRFL